MSAWGWPVIQILFQIFVYVVLFLWFIGKLDKRIALLEQDNNRVERHKRYVYDRLDSHEKQIQEIRTDVELIKSKRK